MENKEKAERILAALDNSKVPISWHCIYEQELVEVIAQELSQIDKDEGEGNE